MSDLGIRQDGDGVVLGVKVVPGSSRTALCGWLDGMVKVKVAAAPERGKANECLCELLAKKLGVKKGAVRIIAGATSPVKQVRIEGVTVERVERELGLADRD